MTTYRVSFFKNLLSSDGHQHKCLQQQLDVSNAASPRQAAQYAARRFETLRGVRVWTMCADMAEVETQGCATVFASTDVLGGIRKLMWQANPSNDKSTVQDGQGIRGYVPR
jgi:hypothetical protein